jgi:enamine deaminase RidA (YjgF/YER057c/UK114 family)
MCDMKESIESRLAQLGIALPKPAPPAGNYVPFAISGPLLFISGQLPIGPDGLAFEGRLGRELDVAAGQAAARLCAINILAQAKAALNGDLGRLSRCVKLGGFVNAAEWFKEHPAVINGASDLIAEAMGEAGRHARAAIGASSLPLGAAVEIDAIFEIDAVSAIT